jgi:hypothetical protein
MQAGDLVFAHTDDLVGKGIRWAERIRFRGGAAYNHVATLYEFLDGEWNVIQAQARGIVICPLSRVAPDGSYTIIQPPTSVNTAKQIEFLEKQLGDSYGFLTIASILVNLFLPHFINVEMPGTWICSAVAAEALRYGGWYNSWPDIYEVSPAQLYEVMYKQAETVDEIGES